MDHPLHPDLEPLSFLLGSWKGRGHGTYPTIDDFAYTEEVTYAHVGKPFIAYTQKSRDGTWEEPLHSEAGYLRPTGPTTAELVIVQPSGILEVHEGIIADSAVEFRSVQVIGTATAKEVTEVRRALEVDEGEMRYEVDMQAVGQPLQLHLEAHLFRDV